MCLQYVMFISMSTFKINATYLINVSLFGFSSLGVTRFFTPMARLTLFLIVVFILKLRHLLHIDIAVWYLICYHKLVGLIILVLCNRPFIKFNIIGFYYWFFYWKLVLLSSFFRFRVSDQRW